mmetsp:Transcript_91606/g.142943  ORF Transcript_91606/g.142943 Transcript_91606/m.142943 type:complete len:977 (+) Transcript_91606:52-2982(+)
MSDAVACRSAELQDSPQPPNVAPPSLRMDSRTASRPWLTEESKKTGLTSSALSGLTATSSQTRTLSKQSVLSAADRSPRSGSPRGNVGTPLSLHDRIRLSARIVKDEQLKSQDVEWWSDGRAAKQKLRRLTRCVRDNKIYKIIMGVSLVFALVAVNLWQIFNIPDDPGNVILDTLMMLVLFAFMLDLAILCFADYGYIGSFFFWMDVMGSCSLVFDISFFLGTAGQMNTPQADVDPGLLRAARTAKLGTRSGRLLKLLKCLPFIFGGGVDVETDPDQAKKLASRLAHYLSSKAALLTVLLVVVLPLLQIVQYPEDDLSLRGWVQRAENDYRLSVVTATHLASNQAGNESFIFQNTVEEMLKFYEHLDYYPYRMEGYSERVVTGGFEVLVPGQSQMSRAHPARLQNVVRQTTTECGFARPGCEGGTKAAIYYDFTQAHRLMAGMDIASITFIIFVMVLMSFALIITVRGMILQPLDRMLTSIRKSASAMLGKCTKLQKDDHAELSDDEAHEDDTELLLLEYIFAKLQKIIEIYTDTVRGVDESMDNEAAGVIELIQEQEVYQDTSIPRTDLANRISMCHKRSSGVEKQEAEASRMMSPSNRKLPVKVEALSSWNLHVLELREDEVKNVMLHIYFDTMLGQMAVHPHVDEGVFRCFQDYVAKAYFDAPYHNYFHACDVSFTVFRLLCETHSQDWLPAIDIYALLIAAYCHDVGHQGRTNPFLVETGHELALRYNDKSPLENMHASTLFEICNMGLDANVFKNLNKDDFKQARKVCVATILHTDNSHHFDMVKTLKSIYEVSSDIVEQQAASSEGILHEMYVEEVLDCHVMTWLELFLHFSDVSNPMKPFRICQEWAWRVLDEFFDQGDEEKELGLPVGMLNDRDKINRPHSQHGFIKFLVAPFAQISVRLFPWLHPLTTNLAANYHQWRDLWVLDAKPSVEDLKPVDDDSAKLAEEAQELAARCNIVAKEAASLKEVT